jgi:hypothetical protein
VLPDRAGIPLSLAVSAANTNDSAFEPLIRAIPAIRSRRGPCRRKHRPCLVAGQISAFLYLFTGGTPLVSRFFRPAEFLELLEREEVNSTFLTPLMLYELLDHPDIGKRDLSAMVVLSVGTAAANPVRLRQTVDRLMWLDHGLSVRSRRYASVGFSRCFCVLVRVVVVGG